MGVYIIGAKSLILSIRTCREQGCEFCLKGCRILILKREREALNWLGSTKSRYGRATCWESSTWLKRQRCLAALVCSSLGTERTQLQICFIQGSLRNKHIIIYENGSIMTYWNGHIAVQRRWYEEEASLLAPIYLSQSKENLCPAQRNKQYWFLSVSFLKFQHWMSLVNQTNRVWMTLLNHGSWRMSEPRLWTMQGPGIAVDKHLRDPPVLPAAAAVLEKRAMFLHIIALKIRSNSNLQFNDTSSTQKCYGEREREREIEKLWQKLITQGSMTQVPAALSKRREY